MFKRNNFKFYKQSSSMDCGPTCLKMIVKYYGKDISLQLLKDLSNTSREGSSIISICNAGKEIGFKCIAIKCHVNRSENNNNIPALNELKLPLIAHWKQNHYVIIYKIKNNMYFIADPAIGKITLPENEIKKNLYSSGKYGRVILFEPMGFFFNERNHHFQNKSFSYNFEIIKQKLAENKNKFLFLLFLLVIQLLIQISSPIITQITFDSGILEKNINVLTIVFVTQTIIYIFSSIISYSNGLISNKIAQSINYSFLNSFTRKLLNIPLYYFQSHRSSDFIHKIYDINKVESYLTYNLSSNIVSFFGAITLSLFAIYYNSVAFLLIMLFSFFNVIWTNYSLKKQREINYDKFDIQVRTHRYLIELVEGIKDIKLNGSASKKINLLLNNQLTYYKNNLNQIKLTQYLNIGGGFINNMSSGIMVFYTSYLTIQNKITIGEMAALQLIINMLSSKINNIISSVSIIQETKFSLERILETQLIEDEKVGVKEIEPNSSIAFKNVSFSYSKQSDQILKNISFTIDSGCTTAIVGESGSGKTTILNLVLGFQKATSGKILYGNNELGSFNIVKWREKCGVVLQDGYLFTDTIRNNITNSNDKLFSQNYINSLKWAGIYDFVDGLPLKGNTIIGKDGLGISQGQKQRILIARLFYRNPDYIFLDEATNSLDSKTEKIVINNLSTVFAKKTKLIIAHRLNTIIHADKIIVLKEGSIIEQGSHDYLIKNCNYYYELFKEQI